MSPYFAALMAVVDPLTVVDTYFGHKLRVTSPLRLFEGQETKREALEQLLF